MAERIKRLQCDIARCGSGERCWQNEKCARYVFRNTGGDRVAYFLPEPPEENEKCLYHLSVYGTTYIEEKPNDE